MNVNLQLEKLSERDIFPCLFENLNVENSIRKVAMYKVVFTSYLILRNELKLWISLPVYTKCHKFAIDELKRVD